jgi:hypothetical protein
MLKDRVSLKVECMGGIRNCEIVMVISVSDSDMVV